MEVKAYLHGQYMCLCLNVSNIHCSGGDLVEKQTDWLTYFSFRWLDVGVAHLTSAPCWVIYLQVLQEAVWPGGTLPAQPRPERSAAEREETKERCLECLMQLLPGIQFILWMF